MDDDLELARAPSRRPPPACPAPAAAPGRRRCRASRSRRWRRTGRWRRPRSGSAAGRRARPARPKSDGMVTTKATLPLAISASASAGAASDMVEAVVAGVLQRRDHGARVAGRCSSASSAAGRLFGSLLMAKPNSTSCISGTPSIMAKVMRSRRIWMNSLISSAPSRAKENSRRRVHAMLSLRAGHELDEHVLEAGLAGLDRDAGPICGCRQAPLPARPGRSRRHAASRRTARPGRRRACRASASATSSSRAPCDDEGGEPGIAHHLLDRAGGEHLAIGDVADAVAALGLVHVVGRDQHGQPAARQPVDLVPELAPRLGVDAGRRLVEQQQLRLVHDAGGQRQPLLPAARQRAGELVAPRWSGRGRPASSSTCSLDRLQLVEPRDEFEVLARWSDPRRTRIAASCSRPRA